MRVEEISPGPASNLIGKTMKEANITDSTGLLVIATHNMKSGDYKYNPKSTYTFDKDDVLITIGNIKQFEEFKKKFNIK